MKRIFIVFIVFLVLIGLMVGCNDQANSENIKDVNELKQQVEQLLSENKNLQNIVEEQRNLLEETNRLSKEKSSDRNSDSSIKRAYKIDTYPQSLYQKATLDLDNDGENEVIELYVNAIKMENDSFAWDDGQTWLLVVNDGEKTYPLFDDFVQLGSIHFSTTTYDGIPSIVMLKTSPFGSSVHRFSYVQNLNGFEEEISYRKENMLQQYNQSASYALFEDAYRLVEQALVEKVESVLETSVNDLQEHKDRIEIFAPISEDLRYAKRLFVTAVELNPELAISINHVLELINQMIINPPTSAQLKQLSYIHDELKKVESDEVIIKEQNRIHPDIKNSFQKMDIIINGKR